MKLADIHKFLFGTLRGRLIFSVAAIHALLMTLFIADMTVGQRAMLLKRQVEDATGLARTLATSSAIWLAAYDLAGLQELVEAQRSYPDLTFVMLTDNGGRILAHTDASRRGQFLLDLPTDVSQTLINKNLASVDVAVPALLEDRQVGWARVGISQKTAARKLFELTLKGGIYALAAIVIGAVIAWLLGRQITQRLYIIQQTINKVYMGDSSARVPIVGADEATVMAREFNAMLDTLAAQKATLAVSEEVMSRLIEESPVAIAITVGTDNVVQQVNKKFTELFGYSREDIPDVGQWDSLTYTEESYRGKLMAECFVRVALETTMKGSCQPLEATVVCKDGDLRNIEAYMSAIGGRMLTTFIDITERKRTQRALQQSEEFLNSIIENIPNMLFVKEAKDLRFVLFNKAGEDLLGYAREDMYGKNDFDFFPPGEATYFVNTDREVLKSRQISDIADEVIETRQHGKRILHTKKIPITDAKGDPQFLLGISEDITEHRQAELALAQASIEWSTAMDASEDAIYLLDMNRRLLRGNKTFHLLTGTTPATARGTHIVDIMHAPGETTPCPVCVAQEAQREGSIIMESDHPDNPSGLPLKITLKMVRDENGHPVSMLMVLHDLTQERKVQQELTTYREHLEELVRQRTTALDEKNQELEHFNKLFVGRELKMIELKAKIKELEDVRGEAGIRQGDATLRDCHQQEKK